MKSSQDAVARAVELLGGRSALAKNLGISTVAVGQWLKPEHPGGRKIPPRQCARIEQLTDFAVSRRNLRPDDWREIWPDLEEVEHLRAQVAQLLNRLRAYESDAAPALTLQAPAAINSEATEVTHA